MIQSVTFRALIFICIVLIPSCLFSLGEGEIFGSFPATVKHDGVTLYDSDYNILDTLPRGSSLTVLRSDLYKYFVEHKATNSEAVVLRNYEVIVNFDDVILYDEQLNRSGTLNIGEVLAVIDFDGFRYDVLDTSRNMRGKVFKSGVELRKGEDPIDLKGFTEKDKSSLMNEVAKEESRENQAGVAETLDNNISFRQLEITPFFGAIFSTESATSVFGVRAGTKLYKILRFRGDFELNRDDNATGIFYLANLIFEPEILDSEVVYGTIGMGGLSVFLPDGENSSVFTLAAGGGAKLFITHNLALRPEYRGLFFLRNGNTDILNELTVGLTFLFGQF